MGNMFYNCSSLTSINISSFKTPKLGYIDRMFANCSSLEIINISNFDTSRVKSNNELFFNCTSLNDIDISSFGETINYEQLFNNRLPSEGKIKINKNFYDNITKIIPKNWEIEF